MYSNGNSTKKPQRNQFLGYQNIFLSHTKANVCESVLLYTLENLKWLKIILKLLIALFCYPLLEIFMYSMRWLFGNIMVFVKTKKETGTNSIVDDQYVQWIKVPRALQFTRWKSRSIERDIVKKVNFLMLCERLPKTRCVVEKQGASVWIWGVKIAHVKGEHTSIVFYLRIPNQNW